MSSTAAPAGRRERNKQAKLERIISAASELFAARGVDEVTTQQIADAADIGSGTLFLYAKTKGELLLLVQNHHYAKSLESGVSAAAKASNTPEALMALILPVIECNRTHVENGRTYLREMLFGDPTEPHHAAALKIVGQTNQEIAQILIKHQGMEPSMATTLARVISSIQFVTMASALDPALTVSQVANDVRAQIAAVLQE